MRILLATSRFPLPPRRGNQRRTVEWLDALADHDLTVACPTPGRALPNGVRLPGAATLQCWPRSALAVAPSLLRAMLGGRPLQEALYDTPAARRVVTAALRHESWDLVVVQMVRMAWVADLVAREAPAAPVLFDLVDSMAFHFSRAGADFPAVLRPLLRAEALRCRRREQAVAARAALTVAVAERELHFLSLGASSSAVVAVSGSPPETGSAQTTAPTVLLSGNLGYRPTVRGAQWFAAEVWPRVRRLLPAARWRLVGARPGRALRQLAELPGVELVADPPEMDHYLTSSWLAIAPMASGSGVPMKVLEAWAAGLPVIAHPHAVAGLATGSADGVATAGDADEWCDAVCRLLGDQVARTELAARGRRQWAEHYAPERVAATIREAVARALG